MAWLQDGKLFRISVRSYLINEAIKVNVVSHLSIACLNEFHIYPSVALLEI